MIESLPTVERQLLFRFLCTFAWADGEVSDAERRFVRRLMDKLVVTPEERLDFEAWLLHPPAASEVELASVAAEHKGLFVQALRALVFVDGRVTEDEKRQFDALRAALMGG